jgi:hypothetical protein
MVYREFIALAMVCRGIHCLYPSALQSCNADGDAPAIQGRLGAQVALLQSPILPTARETYFKKTNFRALPIDKPHTRNLRIKNFCVLCGGLTRICANGTLDRYAGERNVFGTTLRLF